MLKNLAALEVKIGERFYRMMCEVDSPIGEVHDALCQMRNHVVQKIIDARNAEQPAPEEKV